jgi:hypothetical protein
MRKLRIILVAVLMGTMISIGAFAQKGGNDNRPPKDNPKVVEKPKPPPSNNNQSNSNKPRKP